MVATVTKRNGTTIEVTFSVERTGSMLGMEEAIQRRSKRLDVPR